MDCALLKTSQEPAGRGRERRGAKHPHRAQAPLEDCSPSVLSPQLGAGSWDGCPGARSCALLAEHWAIRCSGTWIVGPPVEC